jgi:transporter family-2 protein
VKAAWIYPFILLGGALQTCGAAMNARLFGALTNRWLATLVSFVIITAFFFCLFLIQPRPLPTLSGIQSMPWWAPLGGLVGAVQVFAGLTLVGRVGAGPFMGLTVTAALIASVLIDNFGWFGLEVHPVNAARVIGSLLLVGGVTLIAKY